MSKGKLLFAMLEPMVDKAIRDVRENPGQAVGKLLNLAEQMISDPGNKRIFQDLRPLMETPGSHYNKLVHRLSLEVAPGVLKGFGFNLGYNSLSSGVKQTKKRSRELGAAIPWAMLYDLQQDGKQLEPEELDSLLTQGEDLGIFCHVVFPGSGYPMEGLFRTLGGHRDSAVILLLPPGDITGQAARMAARMGHIAFAIPMDGGKVDPGLEAAIRSLREHGALYGFALDGAPPENRDELEGCARLFAPLGAYYLFWLEKRLPSRQERDRLQEQRTSGDFPLLLSHLYGDILTTAERSGNQLVARISPGFLEVSRPGQPLQSLPRESQSLLKLLRQIPRG